MALPSSTAIRGSNRDRLNSQVTNELLINGNLYTPSRLGKIISANTEQDACRMGGMDSLSNQLHHNSKSEQIKAILNLFDKNGNGNSLSNLIDRFIVIAIRNKSSHSSSFDIEHHITNNRNGASLSLVIFKIDGVNILEIRQELDHIVFIVNQKTFYGSSKREVIRELNEPLPSLGDFNKLIDKFHTSTNISPCFPSVEEKTNLQNNSSIKNVIISANEYIVVEKPVESAESKIPTRIKRPLNTSIIENNSCDVETLENEYIAGLQGLSNDNLIELGTRFNKNERIEIKSMVHQICSKSDLLGEGKYINLVGEALFQGVEVETIVHIGQEHTDTTWHGDVFTNKPTVAQMIYGFSVLAEYNPQQLLDHHILPSHAVGYVSVGDSVNNLATVAIIAPRTHELIKVLHNSNLVITPELIQKVTIALQEAIRFLDGEKLAMQITSLGQIKIIKQNVDFNSEAFKVYFDLSGMVTDQSFDLLKAVDEETENVVTNQSNIVKFKAPIWANPSNVFSNHNFDIAKYVQDMRAVRNSMVNKTGEYIHQNNERNQNTKYLIIQHTKTKNCSPLIINATTCGVEHFHEKKNYVTQILETKNLVIMTSVIWALGRKIDSPIVIENVLGGEVTSVDRNFEVMRKNDIRNTAVQKSDLENTFRLLGVSSTDQLDALKMLIFNQKVYFSSETIINARAALNIVATGINPKIEAKLETK